MKMNDRRRICRRPEKNRRVARKCIATNDENIRTNSDYIRTMSDTDLAAMLTWRATADSRFRVPDCSECCNDYDTACAFACSIEKRVRVMTAWLREEYRR